MPAALAVLVVVLANAYHRAGHPQGDDFALYLRQAKSVFEGTMAQVVADNRFSVLQSAGEPFSPFAYPWGFPLLLSPFVNRWGLDYDRLKWVTVGCLAVWVVLVHGVVRRRAGRGVAFAVALAVGTMPAMLRHTDSLLSEFPHALATGVVFWWYDRIVRRHGRLLEAPLGELAWLGVLGAIAFNVRREGVVLLAALGIVQVADVAAGRWRAWRGRDLWRRAVAPHLSFVAAVFVLQITLPTMLFPDNGDALHYVDDRLRQWAGLLTEQLGLGRHPALGTALLLLALTGSVVGVRRRPHLDGLLAAHTMLTVVAVSSHFRIVGRYYLQALPWILYFCVVAILEGVRAVRTVLVRDADDGAGGDLWRWTRVVVPILPLTWLIGLHAMSIRDDVEERSTADAAGFVHQGPAHPDYLPVFEAVRRLTHPDDVVVFYRARTMTLLTDRRAVQTTSLERVVRVGDWFAQQRNSDFFQPDADAGALEALGLEIVWSDAHWILWRIP